MIHPSLSLTADLAPPRAALAPIVSGARGSATVGAATAPAVHAPEGAAVTEAARPAITFAFRFAPAFRAAGAPLGITPGRCRVEVGPDAVTAHFGFWSVSTPLANVRSATVSGPYDTVKVIGGPRLSFVDHGLTFATNARAGVCISFIRPVVGIDPTGRMCHPGLTVTVADPSRLATLLEDLAVRARLDGVPVRAEVDDAADLAALSSAELRTRARDLGLSGVGRLRKAELVELLSAPDFPTS